MQRAKGFASEAVWRTWLLPQRTPPVYTNIN